MFPLCQIDIITFQLSYEIGLLFPLEYSLFSMIIVSDSSWNAPLLKVIRTVPFLKFHMNVLFSMVLRILYNFFDLEVHSWRQSWLLCVVLHSEWKQKSFQVIQERNAVSVKSGSFWNRIKNDPVYGRYGIRTLIIICNHVFSKSIFLQKKFTCSS